MKKYLLFIYQKYYPLGGVMDFKDSYDTIEEIDLSEQDELEFVYQIVDRYTMKVILTNDKFILENNLN